MQLTFGHLQFLSGAIGGATPHAAAAAGSTDDLTSP